MRGYTAHDVGAHVGTATCGCDTFWIRHVGARHSWVQCVCHVGARHAWVQCVYHVGARHVWAQCGCHVGARHVGAQCVCHVGARHGVPLRVVSTRKGIQQIRLKILGIFKPDREAYEIIGAFSPLPFLF